MRPGQITITGFEAAILEQIAKDHAVLVPFIDQLHVLSREFTGAGSYTKFIPGLSSPDLPDGYLSLDALISLPGVPNGLGAVLSCKGGHPTFLEIYTYGDELWDGDFDGFSIAAAA